MDKVAPKETMDRLLMYRNLLCAEDHIDEILNSATTSDEYQWLRNWKNAIESIRSHSGFEEEDLRYHCLTKHLAVAYEAAREVAKASHSESDFERANLLGTHLRWSLEKLIGAHIENCGRCKEEHELGITDEQNADGGAVIESSADELGVYEDGDDTPERSEE